MTGRGDSDEESDLLRSFPSAAASIRDGGEDFSVSFLELRDRVERACSGEVDWEARVVAAVRTVVAFVVAEPAKGRALTVEARRSQAGEAIPAQRVVAYFAESLARIAPAERRAKVSTDASVVESIALVIRGHLLAGSVEDLPRAVPDLVYLALMPYLGIAESRGWSMALETRKTG